MPKLIDIVLAEDTEGSVARLERWLIEAGATVAADQPVAEIETDKVTLEICAPGAGVLRETLVTPGQELASGMLLGRIEASPTDSSIPTEKPAEVEIRFAEEHTEGTTATLSRWLLAAGEAVAEGEPVAEIETDKVNVEIVAPASGVLKSIAVAAGEPVEPGALLGSLTTTSEVPPPGDDQVRQPAPVDDFAPARQRISPAVRRLMAEHRLDSLEGIAGSGRGGRVRREDLLAWLAERPEAGPSQRATDGLVGRMVAHSNMRRSIARHMAASLRDAPHVTSLFEADLGAVVSHRGEHRAAFQDGGVKLTYTAYFLAAAARAMAVVPEVNARFHADALEIFEDVNIGVGTALGDQGLIVPVVRAVQRLDLIGIAREVQEKTDRARAGKLSNDDLRNGTFTISNHGISGSLLAAPIIINQPQVAILGVGKLEKRVRVVERDGRDRALIRPMCYVSLSIDHRALDAHQTNRWLGSFVDTLEHWPRANPTEIPVR